MTDNQFDNFVRAKLHDHSAPVPAGLWDKVNPAKDDDDRKGIIVPRKFRWGLPLLALLILAGSVTGYFIFSDHATDSIAGNQDAVAQTGPGNNTSVTKQNTTSGIQQQNNPSLNQENITGTNSNTINTTAGKPAAAENTPAAVTQGTSTANNNNNNTRAAITDTDTKTADNNAQNNITIGNTRRKNLAPGSIESVQAFHQAAKNKAPLPFVSNAAQRLKEEENSSAAALTEEEAMQYPVTFSGNFEPGNTISLSSINMGLRGMMQRDRVNTAYTRKFKNIIICPPYKTRNTDWFADVYVSPDIAFKTVENRSATPQYLARKDSSESMRLGYTAGVRLVKPITDNFLVRAGVQYTQINEKFTYRTEDEVKTITVISVRTIIRGPGDTLRITDTSTVQQVGYKTNAIKNRYRSFDIPVTVGYQFGNDNLKFGINAGVVFNISSWYQGVILDSSLAAVPISKGSNQVYKSNIGMGLYGGISILKKMGENTQLFFEPYFRYNLSAITSGQASYQQKFSLGGLSVGLRYNLNRQ